MFMWKLSIFKRKRSGFALVFTILIALAMIIPVMILASNATSRRRRVSGEAVSDRVLTVADAMVDKILDKINTFPPENVSGYNSETDAQNAVIANWEGEINGFQDNKDFSSDNENNVTSYFYYVKTDTWYVLWSTPNAGYPYGHILNVSDGIKLGREADGRFDGTVLTIPVYNLNQNTFENKSVSQIDSQCLKDNLWFEIDANAVKDEDGPDNWTITVSAYSLSNPKIIRTIKAVAKKSITTNETTVVEYEYNWFTMINRRISFGDYVFLDNFDTNYGHHSVTNGIIRTNGDVNMGGWAKYPIYASGTITGEAVDYYYENTGQFGPDKKDIDWAKSNGYANEHVAEVDWIDVEKALFGSDHSYDSTDPNGGIQDKADKDTGCYIDGDAQLEFHEDGTITVTKDDGSSYDITNSPNNVIFVDGNASISGVVNGRWTVGSSNNIYISGNIEYKVPPRTEEDDVSVDNPDFLGLVSGENVLIPYDTFLNYPHLRIDAAIVAQECFGIDPDDWDWHILDTSGRYRLVINGSIAAGDGTMMPVVTKTYFWLFWEFHYIKGYDIRNYNYDWNLRQFGTPPAFPVVYTGEDSSTPIETIVTKETMFKYGIVSNDGEWEALHNFLKSQDPSVHDEGNPVTYNGREFYAKKAKKSSQKLFSVSTVGRLYRLSWKEQIAEPVKP